MDRFRIIVPLFNDAPWVERCLRSIQRQTVTEWTCHCADDCSDDDSLTLAQSLIRDDPRFVFSQNRQRLYQAGSYQRLLGDPSWSGRDICVAVDADDYLPDDGVLARVRDAYADGRTWLTWGNHEWTDGSTSVCGPLENTARVRQVTWRTSHLRTWRLFLWRRIRLEDFLGPDGQPLRAAGDVAAMFAMIEMAGNSHVRYLQSVNYVYNRSNPASNFRVRAAEQLRNAAHLRSLPPYSPLPDDALERWSGPSPTVVSPRVEHLADPSWFAGPMSMPGKSNVP